MQRYLFHCLISSLFAITSAKGQHYMDMLQKSSTEDTNSTVFVSHITLAGNIKTRNYIVRRDIPVQENQYIDRSILQQKLITAKNNLLNSQLYVDVNIACILVCNDTIDVNIQLKERWYIFPMPYLLYADRNFNQWWVQHKASLSRLNYGIDYTQNNVTGRNDKLNLTLITGYTQQTALQYTFPYIDKKLRHGIFVGASYFNVKELNYVSALDKQLFYKQDNAIVREQTRINIGYTYRHAIKTQHIFTLALLKERIADSILIHNPNYINTTKNTIIFPTFFYSFRYVDADYIPYPLHGGTVDISFLKKGYTSEMNLWQIAVNAKRSWPLSWPKFYINLQTAAILKFPFRQPYYNQNLFGYDDINLRGLEYYVVDGAAGGMLRNTFKREIFNFHIHNPFFNSKIHDRIPIKIFLNAFTDMGYAYQPQQINSRLNNRLLYTGGLGVDIITFYDILLSATYSFNQLGQHGVFLNYRIGL